ncbi:MAG: ABC transporter ATP-binding protein [Anaerolineae bacterium]|nr:MAG: ABC transporter ATP-binding protein [Anaerolineae bacterium]
MNSEQKSSLLENRPGANALVSARDLGRTYRRGQEEVIALQGLTFDLDPGSFSFVVGPSGCGKSTLLHLLGGIDQPTSGTLTVSGVQLDIADESSLAPFRRDHIGFVFQFYNLLPALNAVENVAMPLLARGWGRRAAMVRAAELLEEVSLAHRSQHKPAELSGGEQQRVAIARAVVGEPSIVLADEPTGDLDTKSGLSVMELMLDFNRRLNMTFLIATHNQSLCSLGDRLLNLDNGRLREA